jgi:hypothetical protein
MLDDLRNTASSPFLNEEGFEQEEQLMEEEGPRPFLGMTPVQRFVISVFLFFMVLILGGFLLVLFQKVFPAI